MPPKKGGIRDITPHLPPKDKRIAIVYHMIFQKGMSTNQLDLFLPAGRWRSKLDFQPSEISLTPHNKLYFKAIGRFKNQLRLSLQDKYYLKREAKNI